MMRPIHRLSGELTRGFTLQFLAALSVFAIFPAMISTPSLAAVQAQPSLREGAGFLAIGGSSIAIGDLNERLEAAGYPTFGRRTLTIGGGGYTIHPGGLLVGGEGYGVLTGEEAFQGRAVSLGGGYGLFNVGYATDLVPNVRAYPMVGIGGGGATLRIGSQPAGDSFDDVLAAPGRHSSLTRGGFLLSLGAGVEYRANPGGRGLLLGVRAGYLFAPVQSAWRLDSNALEGAPDSSLAGPYVRVTIGRGGAR